MMNFRIKTVAMVDSYSLSGVDAEEFVSEIEGNEGQVISFEPNEDIDKIYPAKDYRHTNRLLKRIQKEFIRNKYVGVHEIQLHISW